MSRYVVRLESDSAHCCFTASVVDTEEGRCVCECLKAKDAERIARVLNAEENKA